VTQVLEEADVADDGGKRRCQFARDSGIDPPQYLRGVSKPCKRLLLNPEC
jgi:hypothetical protein